MGLILDFVIYGMHTAAADSGTVEHCADRLLSYSGYEPSEGKSQT